MSNWIDLEGLANLRDLGGVPTTDGGAIRPRRLLRSDNLQTLTGRDVAELRQRGLTDVVDLRSSVETEAEGPGPLTREDWVTVHHFSFFLEPPAPADDRDNPSPALGAGRAAPGAALPWVGKSASAEHDNAATAHYLSYLIDRPDSVLAGLRTIAGAEGAALVHCAAGKDRTGTLVALALLVAGADPDAVIADYAASSERMERIVARLVASPTYADNLRDRPLSSHLTRPETMAAMIDHLESEFGGVIPALTTIGWTDADTITLRAKLLD